MTKHNYMKIGGFYQKGLSLAEILISVFVFMITVHSLLSVYTQSVTTSKRAEFSYIAYNLAKNHMERLKAFPYNQLPSAAETAVKITKDGDLDPEGPFVRSTTVSLNYAGNANLTQIVVAVAYVFQGVQVANPTQLTTVIYNG